MAQKKSEPIEGEFVNADNDFASQFKGSEMREVVLSRPSYKPGSGAPLHGLCLGLIGPFPPAKSERGKPDAKDWYAQVFKVISPTPATDVDGKDIIVQPGGEVMAAETAQTRNLRSLICDREYAHEFKILPGPQPKPNQMRTFQVQRGRSVARGTVYPLLMPSTASVAPRQLTAGDPGDSAETPF